MIPPRRYPARLDTSPTAFQKSKVVPGSSTSPSRCLRGIETFTPSPFSGPTSYAIVALPSRTLPGSSDDPAPAGPARPIADGADDAATPPPLSAASVARGPGRSRTGEATAVWLTPVDRGFPESVAAPIGVTPPESASVLPPEPPMNPEKTSPAIVAATIPPTMIL